MKKVIIALLAMVMMTTMPACSVQETTATEGANNEATAAESAMNADYDVIAYATEIHKYAPSNSFSESEGILKGVCDNRGRVMITVIDGAPYIAYDEELPKKSAGVSNITSQRESESYALELTEFAKTLQPETSENDVLAGLSLTLRKLSLYSGKKILVFDGPGIFTSGEVDMSYIMNNDAEDVIQQLKKQNSIPQAEGDVTVLCIGLGEPVGAQPKPNNNDYAKLEDFYRAYFQEAGAKEIIFVPRGTRAEWDDSSYPEVSVYEFPNATILSEEEIEFKFDTSDFSDPGKASSTIESISHNYNVGEHILVVGFASSEGSTAYNVKLSKERADVVAKLLEDQGLKTTSLGRGFDPNYCIPDSEDGVLDEEYAKKNRKIIVINYDSNEARDLLDKSSD